MSQTRSTLIRAAILGVATALSLASADAAMTADSGGPLRPDRSPAGLQLAEGQPGVPAYNTGTVDREDQIRAELQKLSAGELKLEDIIGNIDTAIMNTDLPRDEQDALRAKVRRTVDDWARTHAPADRTDRDAVGQLLLKIADVGVAVDVIVPAIQKVREAKNRTAPPSAAATDHPPVIIQHRR